MTPELKQEIVKIIREEMQRDYLSGAPKISPHVHNGIDNLPIDSSNIEGDLVTSIIAGTNISISPVTGTGTVTINATAGSLEVKELDGVPDVMNVSVIQVSNGSLTDNGGGNVTIATSGGTGSPGGSDGDLQINASGVFGTIDGLNLDQTGNSRGTEALDIQSKRQAVTDVASGTHSLTIGYSDTASATESTAIGSLNIASGGRATAVGWTNTASGDSSSSIGNNNSATGIGCSSIGFANTSTNVTGSPFTSVAIGNGNDSVVNSIAMGIDNTSGSVLSMAFGNSNVADTGTGNPGLAIGYLNDASGEFSCAIGFQNDVSGAYCYALGNNITNANDSSIFFGTNFGGGTDPFNFSFNSETEGNFGGGIGVISIEEVKTAPTTFGVGSGILYVSGGALHYLGSSGTDTIIAPA